MQRKDQWVGGAVLIAIGAALLLGQLVGETGQFVTLGIGLVLLVLFAVSRNPGTLIGGGIVTGIGAGVLVAANTEGDIAGAAVLFGLGFGFIGVWLIGTLMRVKEISFWPLIPGSILVVVGIVVLAGSEAAKTFELIWPALLIGLGVIVLIAAMRGRGTGPAGGGEG
jgi:apolipoprotein N-acyltransferase